MNDVSRNLSEAEILRLHQEQDPASPLFKGFKFTGTGLPGTTAGNSEPTSAYYEPTADKVDPIADTIPAPEGTTTISTEEVSKPYEAFIEPTSEDESITGA